MNLKEAAKIMYGVSICEVCRKVVSDGESICAKCQEEDDRRLLDEARHPDDPA